MIPETAPNPSSTRLGDEPGTTPPLSEDRCWRHRSVHHHHRGYVHRIVLGITVIAWGALLLLRDTGAVNPALHVLDFWPILLVGFGLSALLRWRNLGAALFGLIIALLGAGLLGETLGYVSPNVVHLWPVLIIAAGVAVILRPTIHRRPHGSVTRETVSEGVLKRAVTMGSLKLAIDSQEFKGAKLGATMGEVQVDLRRATMVGDEAIIEVTVVMGGVELLVPPHWQVVSDVSPFMGAVEDKTEPRPDATGVQKRLVLRGSITMGAVNVRN